MNIKKKLIAWQENKLIDANTAQAIAAYEAAQPRVTEGMWRYGILGLGVLCIALGLIFIIAANWQNIPFPVKLWTHTAFNFALAGVILYAVKKDKKWESEIALLILSAAQLSLLSLIGQYMQIGASFEDAMTYWWLLIAPMLVLLGHSSFSATLLISLGLYIFFVKWNLQAKDVFLPLLGGGSAFYLLGRLPSLKSVRPGWSHTLNTVGFYAVALTALILLMGLDLFTGLPEWALACGFLFFPLIGFLYLKKRDAVHLQDKPEQTEAFILSLAAIAFAQPLQPLQLEAFWAVLFSVYCLAISRIGYRHGNTGYLSAGIIFTAVRLIVYFVSVTDNMLINGLVMIAIGLVTICVLRKLLQNKGGKNV